MKKSKLITLFFITLLTINPSNVGIVQAKILKKPQSMDYRLAYLNLDWWSKFNDEKLKEYLLISYQNNQDLKIATLKTKQTQQIVKQSLAQELPQIGFSGNFQRELRSSDVQFGELIIPNYSQNHFTLPLAMTYELDIWGQNHLRTKSYKKQLEMAKQEERAAYISLTSSVASDYFNLIKVSKLIENQEKLINLQKKITVMEEKKFQNGLCPSMEVISAKQTLTIFEEELNNLKEKRETLENQMLVLLGDRNKKELETGTYENLKMPNIPDNISTEAVKNRPDLLRTEEYIQKIGYDVKVARRDFLPKFLIYGQLGFNAYDWGRIFSGNALLSNAGIAPSFDLFSGGRKLAHLRFGKLEYEKASQLYEKTILTSIQEINDSLSSAKTGRKNYTQSVERNKLEAEKYTLLNKKMKIGAASTLDNLKAQEALLLSEESEISNKINYIISTINVYKAVGGKDYNDFTENI